MDLNLRMGDFKEYVFMKDTKFIYEGVQYVFRFPNSYGASVVKHKYSYGADRDLWELAVIFFVNDHEWELTYDTEITSDVEGYLSDEDVLELLQRIKELE